MGAQSPCPTLTLSDYSTSAGEVSFTVTRTGGNQDLETLEIAAATNPPTQTTVALPAGVVKPR